MPRVRRITAAGAIQHVMNRGNRRSQIFRQPSDYKALISLLVDAAGRFRVKLIAYCLMPNHWHLVLIAEEEGAISSYMRWVTGTHVRRYHKLYRLEGTGHLYQGRYTSIPVQSNRHLLTVLRYVEANAKRAGLVSRAEAWPWSSLGAPDDVRGQFVAESPVPRPPDWLRRVNEPLRNLARLRECIARGRPFGTPAWTARTVGRYGLGFTMRRKGRPKKVRPSGASQAGGAVISNTLEPASAALAAD